MVHTLIYSEEVGTEEPREPEESLERSVGFLLSKLGFHTAAGFTAILEPLGIAPPHFAVLRQVGVAEGSSQQAVAEAVGLPPSRIVAFLDALQERGYVERRRNPADRRAHALFLTVKGRRVVDEGQARANRFEEEICASLSDEERATLLALLGRIAAARGLRPGTHPGMRDGAASMPRPG
jgi:DNA-binding MarR family transcriptional regulator